MLFSTTLFGFPAPPLPEEDTPTMSPVSTVREVTMAREKPSYAPGLVVAHKYRLERCIGTGGMGEVWVAENELLAHRVAIKLLRRSTNIPEARERLLREARTAARLHHPAILHVFDVGLTDQNDPFLVMELLEGENVSQYLERVGVLPSVVAVRIAYTIADGLHAAHRKGVVHRDLKLDNLFLAQNEDGHVQPKIVDFGIAQTHVGAFDQKLTGVGMFLGTPAYLAPEQIGSSADVDGRADLWALGVGLYEMITGQLPFGGATIDELWQSILLSEPPRPSNADDELWAILTTSLKKQRCDRPESADVFRDQLGRWLLRQGVQTYGPFGLVQSPTCEQRTLRETGLRVRSTQSSVRPEEPNLLLDDEIFASLNSRH